MKAVIAAPLAALVVPIDSVILHPRNPRQGDVGAVSESLKRWGQLKPIVVQDSTSYVIAGNHVLRGAIALGWAEIAVNRVELSDRDATAYALADNRTADLGSYDDALLAAILAEEAAADNLRGTGYDGDDVDDLIARTTREDRDADVVPAVPSEVETYVKLGDLWQLGKHRLLCGDSVEAKNVARLMGETKADCMWTAPPLGVNYTGKTRDALTIEGDQPEGLAELLAGAFACATDALQPGAPFYVARPPGVLSLTFGWAVKGVGWKLHQELQWVKDSMVLGHSDYHLKHETILYGWTVGNGRSGRGKHEGSRWYGDNSAVSVFEVPRPKASPDHSTSKPVDLIVPMLLNSSPPGGAIYEPFCGGGSTLIAAEKTGRHCFAMDIDPRYCQVTIERWQEYAGKKAQRLLSGLDHTDAGGSSDG